MVMDPFRFVRSAATAAALALIFGSGNSAISSLAASVPPPQVPSERTTHVATEADLQNAVAAVASNTTIVLAPGTYLLTRTLAISGSLTGVVLRGASANPDDVVLVGRGMTDRNFGAVPHGISVSGNVQGITIANLTIRDVFQHAIVLDAESGRPVIHNVRLLNAGQQFIKANSNGSGGGVDDGVVEYSTIEYTTTARDGSTSGIEVLGGSGWLVRGNLFRNIKAPSGQLAGPAVLMWHGSRDSIVEGNTFLNSQREIAFGLEDRKGHDHSGGIIRNNFVYREPGIQGDAAIHIGDSPDTQVLHNTILASGTFLSLIEYRFPETRGVVIRNNLLDGQIVARNGAKATVASNYTSASPEMFVNAAAGDLHLVGTAVAVIDAAEPLANVTTDWDAQRRPHGSAADYGADEFVGGTGSIGSQSSALSLTSDSSTGGSGTTVTSSASSLTAALPSPWESADIGNPLRAGNASYASGTFTVQGAGTDIAGNADQFRFVYQMLEGDGEIVARVASLERTQPWAKAGVMIRDELTPGAKYASALVTAEKGVYFQYRIANGAMTSQIAGGSGKAPYWVKLTRRGNVFTAFSSNDGSSWATMGSETVNIGRLAYVGLAVTSKAHRNLTTATFTGVAVSPGTSGPLDQAPIVSLTSPSDGSTYSAPATLALSAAASDGDGSVTKVDFYAGSTLIGSSSKAPYGLTWSNVPVGKYALKAVAHDDAGKSSASPVVEVTVVENKPPSVSLTAPANDATFTAPATVTLSATASDSDGTVAGVEFYAGTTLIGMDTSNPYSVTWSNVAAGSYTLTALARDDAGASSASMPVAITVKAAHVNQPPTVSLTSPSAGAAYVAPASITLSANASDPDGTISKVDFFAGNVLIGSDSSSPYSGTWSNVPAGSYTFTAVARDDSGASTTSAPVAITVTSSSPLPRYVVFTASADHATNVTSYTVEIFQAGANPATTSPFRTQNAGKPTPVNGDITVDVSATVLALPAGTYFFTISATGTGGTSRSAPTETFVR